TRFSRDWSSDVCSSDLVVAIASDCPPGLHEARVMTRLGVSSSRIFNVSTLPEVTRQKPNTTLETAMPIEVGSICNAVMTAQAVRSEERRVGKRPASAAG